MTKKVLVTISSLQILEDTEGDTQNDTIEVTTPADYFYKNGKHYVLYDEVAEGYTGHTKNKIKISNGPVVEVTKKGLVTSEMIFEQGKTNVSCYQTPYGEMMMGVSADQIEIKEEEDQIDIHISYGLDVNYSRMADCKIHICIQSREV